MVAGGTPGAAEKVSMTSVLAELRALKAKVSTLETKVDTLETKVGTFKLERQAAGAGTPATPRTDIAIATFGEHVHVATGAFDTLGAIFGGLWIRSGWALL